MIELMESLTPVCHFFLSAARAAPCEKISKWQRLVQRKIAAHCPTLLLGTHWAQNTHITIHEKERERKSSWWFLFHLLLLNVHHLTGRLISPLFTPIFISMALKCNKFDIFAKNGNWYPLYCEIVTFLNRHESSCKWEEFVALKDRSGSKLQLTTN